MLAFYVILGLLVRTSGLVQDACVGSSAELSVYRPWAGFFECRSLSGPDWSACVSAKTGVLGRAFTVSSDCESCYTALGASMQVACASSATPANCVTNSIGQLTRFTECAGFAFTTSTSTACNLASLPAAAEEIHDLYSAAVVSSSAYQSISTTVGGSVGDCEPCYQELAVGLNAAYTAASSPLSADCTNGEFYTTKCFQHIETLMDRFRYCSGMELQTSLVRAPLVVRQQMMQHSMDLHAVEQTMFQSTAPADVYGLTFLKATYGQVTSWGVWDACYRDFLAVLVGSPAPDLALCDAPAHAASACEIKHEIAEFQRCLGGFTMTVPFPACLSHRPVLDTIYQPFADLVACAPVFQANSLTTDFTDCMDERTGFWGVLTTGSATTDCVNCYTALVTKMQSVCGLIRDVGVCFPMLSNSGDLSAFTTCAGYPVSLAYGTCDRSQLSDPKLDSLWTLLPVAFAHVGVSEFALMEAVTTLLASWNYREVGCSSCYARFALDVASLDQSAVIAACDDWRLATAGCREALATPLARFKACAGWDLTNDRHLQCTAADRSETYSRWTSGSLPPPDAAVLSGLSPGGTLNDLTAWAAGLSSGAPCEACFVDLAAWMLAAQTNIGHCVAGDTRCAAGDALGVLELCADWFFNPYTSDVSSASDWAPRRCSEDEIDAVAAMPWSPFGTLVSAESEISDQAQGFSSDPITDWWTDFRSAFATPLTCELCFADLMDALTQIGEYVNIDACKHHREACTGGVHCDGTNVDCPVGFAILKFSRCSGMVFPSSPGESIKADVTFPFPRPVAVSATALTPGHCTIDQWHLFESRMNLVKPVLMLNGAGSDYSLAVSGFATLYERYFHVPPDKQFPCDFCLASWIVFRARLDDKVVTECTAGLSAPLCEALVAAHYEAMVTCAVGSSTKCSVGDVSALTSASPALQPLASAALLDATNDRSNGKSLFIARFVDALLNISGARASRGKSCFSCFTDRARDMFPLLTSDGACATAGADCEDAKASVETDFNTCKRANTLSAPPSSGDSEVMTKCSVEQYVALQSAIGLLDVLTMGRKATTVAGFISAVDAAVSEITAPTVWSELACYTCHKDRATTLFPAVKNVGGVCHDTFESVACKALLATTNAALDTCLTAAVDGVIPTTAPSSAGASALPVFLLILAASLG